MSKSLGNFFSISELLNGEAFGGRKWPGPVLRFAMLKTHYRQPIDWTVRALEEASANLDELLVMQKIDETSPAAPPGLSYLEEFKSALADDLNTPRAISLLLSNSERLSRRVISEMMEMLGIDMQSYADSRTRLLSELEQIRVESRIAARRDARKAKNWAESDRIRDELAAMGIAIKDNKDGTTSWEVKR